MPFFLGFNLLANPSLISYPINWPPNATKTFLKHKLGEKCHHEPTGSSSSADPVRVGDAGDGEDVCSEEEASWNHGEFIHVGAQTAG